MRGSEESRLLQFLNISTWVRSLAGETAWLTGFSLLVLYVHSARFGVTLMV